MTPKYLPVLFLLGAFISLPGICTNPAPMSGSDELEFPQMQSDQVLEPAKILEKSFATYPPKARGTKMSCRVVVAFLIDKEGNAREFRITDSCPDGEKYGFHKAVKNALSKWRFSPGKLNGKPIETETSAEFSFILP